MGYARQILVESMSVIALCCLLSPALADSQAKDKAFIQGSIHRMDEAANNRDADGYVVFTHPDFVNIDKTGKETTHGKEERREKFSRLFSHATQVSQQTTITHITFSKQGAIVDKTSSSTITMSRNGQTMEIKVGGTYRDLWVKSAGHWLQKKSRAVTETFTLNGQPAP